MTSRRGLGRRIRDELWRRPSTNAAALDGIRGFASVIVVLYHSALFTGLLQPEVRARRGFGWLSSFASGSWSGVDMFFVLSGFLIGRILLRELLDTQSLHYGRFLVRRISRIFPAYYLVLTFSVLVGTRLSFTLFYFFYGTTDRAELVGSSWTNYVFLSNYLRPGNRGGVFSWGWSLCVEEHFYLILPPILLLLNRFARSATFSALLAMTALPLLGRAAEYVFDPSLRVVEGFYYFSHNRFDEILVGVLLAYGYVRHEATLARFVRSLGSFAWVIGISLIASVWIFGGVLASGPFPVVFQFTFMACGTALLIANGLFSDNLVQRFFAHRLWYPFARVSYGTYLVHPFVLFAVLEAWGFGRTVRDIRDTDLAALFLFVVALSSVVAGGLFVLVESPFLRWGARWALRPTNPVATTEAGA